MPTSWDRDDQLLSDLQDALRGRHEVPERFVEIGRQAFAWRGTTGELAALTYDSAVPGAAESLAGTRAEVAQLRAMTFTAPGLSIELEVTADALVGQVVPPQRGELDLHPPAGSATTTVAVDDVGWFSIRPKPTGSFRLHLRTAAGQNVVTEWTTL